MAPEAAVLSTAAHAAHAAHIMQRVHDTMSELLSSCTCVNQDQLSIQGVLLSLAGARCGFDLHTGAMTKCSMF